MWGYELNHYGVKGMKWGVRKQKDGHHEYRVDKMRKSGTLSVMENLLDIAVKNGDIVLKINTGAQVKHLPSAKGFKEGRSYLEGDLQRAEELYKELRGTGEPIVDKDGVWLKKERVSSPNVEGYHLDKDGNRTATNKLMIVYSVKGSHLFPRKE